MLNRKRSWSRFTLAQSSTKGGGTVAVIPGGAGVIGLRRTAIAVPNRGSFRVSGKAASALVSIKSEGSPVPQKSNATASHIEQTISVQQIYPN